MKRIFSYAIFGLAFAALPAVLGGCPIYSNDHGNRVCLQSGECYSCPGDYYSSDCYGYNCSSDYDCPNGSSCNGYGSCVSNGVTPTTDAGVTCAKPSDCNSNETCGSNGRCQVGDCANAGCPSGFVCKLSGGALQCVGTGGTMPSDAGKDSDADIPKVDCHNDGECSPLGGTDNKCLDGKCVAPADQCSDATQCPNLEQCVQGVCTPSCDTNKPCPTGYACDANKVCTGNPTPCGAAADAGTCGSGTTCVQDRCVPNCAGDLSCQNGLICVDGGCIPSQRPRFVCATEGVKDSCAVGSLCLHHSCYIGCEADAGATACKSADKFNVCKQVQTTSGTYSVCGSDSNLGTDCDPTRGKNCTAGKACIDGFCK